MSEDWDVVLSFLHEDWRELACETGVFKGLRKDKSVDALLRTLLLHLACGHSLRKTVVRARKANLADLSDVAAHSDESADVAQDSRANLRRVGSGLASAHLGAGFPVCRADGAGVAGSAQRSAPSDCPSAWLQACLSVAPTIVARCGTDRSGKFRGVRACPGEVRVSARMRHCTDSIRSSILKPTDLNEVV